MAIPLVASDSLFGPRGPARVVRPPPTWATVATISGVEEQSEHLIPIQATEWNIRWVARGGVNARPHFQVFLRRVDQPSEERIISTGTGEGHIRIENGPGDYDLRVAAQDVDWTLRIKEKRVRDDGR